MQTLIVILIVLAVLLLLYFLLCALVFNQIAWRRQIRIPSFLTDLVAGNEAPDNYEKLAAAKTEELLQKGLETLEMQSGRDTLRARLWPAAAPSKKIVFACHGARSSGPGEFCFSAAFLHAQGYHLFMPDHRGCGESDGRFMGYGTHESNDAMLWLDYILKRFGNDCEILLYGVSMGAATVLMMSGKELPPNVKGVVSDCAYTSAYAEFEYQLRTSFHLPPFPILPTVNMCCRLFSHYSFRDASPVEAIQKAKIPALFIHGGKDDFVPTFMAGELYDAYPCKKYKLIVPDALHARSYYTAPATYEKAFLQFAQEVFSSEHESVS